MAEEPARRFVAFLRGLPKEAAVWREEETGWTDRDELAAVQTEVLDFWGHVNAIALGVKASALPEPVRIVRPGESDPEPEPAPPTDPNAIAAFFGQWPIEKGAR